MEHAMKAVKAKRKRSGGLRKLQKALGIKDKDGESGEDGSDSDDSVFGDGPSSLGRHRKLVKTHVEEPGKLSRSGLRAMADFVESRGGPAHDRTVMFPAVAVNYLLTVWLPSRKGQLQVGQLRRMRTLATVVDMLVRGRVLSALDYLVQRLKAEELAQEEGSWANAQWMELLAKTEVTMSTDAERRAAGQEEKLERERKEALVKNVDKARGGQGQGLRDKELGAQKPDGGDDGNAQVRRQKWWKRKRSGRGYKKVDGKWVPK